MDSLAYREHGEKAIADSYIIAFSKSDIPNLLVEWFSNQTGVEERVGRPNASTPGALISKFFFFCLHLFLILTKNL